MSRSRSRGDLLHDLTSVAFGFRNKVYLSNRITDNLSFTQRLKLVSRLDVHNGCVNTICWNDSGQYILSGSDDQHLVVFNPFTGKVEASLHTAHRANIFSAKFLPNSQDKHTVSCSADGWIYFNDLEQPDLLNGFDCHLGAVYEVLTVPSDSYTFLSCGEDGTVRWFDLRTKTRCIKSNCEDDVMINTRQAVMSLAINPMMPYQLAIGCADSTVRVYDRRQLSTGSAGVDPSRSGAMLHYFSAPSVKKRNHRITSLTYSHDGEELLVSYSSEHLYLFNFKKKEGENQIPLAKSFKNFDDSCGTSMDNDASIFSDQPSCSSASGTATSGEYVFRPCAGRQPPIKRLRLRGDWSDTGPSARPERERESSEDDSASTIMQRMSNMLTRLLEGRMRQGNSEAQPSDEAAANHESGERGDVPDLPDEAQGNDSSVQTAESSLSSSAASSALFVSCSASDKETSTEDSKEAFEMPECLGTDRSKSEMEDRQTISTEHDDEKTEADEKRFVSGNQIVGEASFSDRRSVVTDDSEFEKSFDGCSKDSGEEVVRSVFTEPVAKQTDGVAVKRESKTSASCEEIVVEPVDEVVTISDVAYEESHSNQREVKIEEVETPAYLGSIPTSSEPVADPVSDRGSRSHQLMEQSSAPEDASDVLQNQCISENLDTVQMSRVESNNREELSFSVESPSVCSMQESAIGGSSVISTPSRLVLPSQHCVDGASPDGGRDQAVDEASSSSGRVEQQEGGLPGLANDSANIDDPPRPSNSNHSDDDSDCEEAYASPASRKAWHEQRLDEKNAAASKLQAVFRQHMEEKMKNREAGLLLPKPAMKQCYLGHRNSRTMIKEASFWGHNYVMSGSDCGHIFIWDRQTAKLVMLLEGDRHVVNCLQPHPYHPILASSGIDYDVKIWMPVHEFPSFDYPKASALMRRNEVMLEETKDTVTVPASFMLRMLLSLNHARRGGRLSGLNRDQPSSRDSSASSRDE